MDQLLEVVGVVIPVVFIGFLVWSRRHFAFRRKKDVQETIRAAIQQGQALTPETVRAIANVHDGARQDLRWGLYLIAASAALLVFAFLSAVVPNDGGPPAPVDWFIALLAVFPGFLGAAFLFLHFTRPKDSN